MELKWLKTSLFFLSRSFLPRSLGGWLPKGWWWEHVGGPGFTRLTLVAEDVGERLLAVN